MVQKWTDNDHHLCYAPALFRGRMNAYLLEYCMGLFQKEVNSDNRTILNLRGSILLCFMVQNLPSSFYCLKFTYAQ